MFYDRFHQLCQERGISCNRAALEIGLSNATPTKWKRSGAIPNLDTLQRIADYFGMSVSRLLEEPAINDDPELTEYVQMLKTRPECRMLFQLSKDATREDVEAAVKIIEALRK